jgi:hypothetical protein
VEATSVRHETAGGYLKVAGVAMPQAGPLQTTLVAAWGVVELKRAPRNSLIGTGQDFAISK